MAEASAVTGESLRAYTAPHPVYTGGAYYQPGQVFVTNAPRGKAWTVAPGGQRVTAGAAASRRRQPKH
ncbi:hypothetical protein [Sphingomonas sp.]|uniref:hypothetical protein n=1 Tax=Sphingomonas sp. TaxID=28214 RepID=UPI003D6D99B7